MEMKKVLKYAMEIGECMLVSGAGVCKGRRYDFKNL